jgi:hypothetical protein
MAGDCDDIVTVAEKHSGKESKTGMFTAVAQRITLIRERDGGSESKSHRVLF